jgi:hypothetical protein
MKHTTEVGSDAMIYVPSFIKTISVIRKFVRVESQSQRKHEDYRCI